MINSDGKSQSYNSNQTATVTSDCKVIDLDENHPDSWTDHAYRMDRQTDRPKTDRDDQF